MSPKFTRQQLEKQIGARGKAATAKIRSLIAAGLLFYQLEPLGPRDPRRARAYVLIGGAARFQFDSSES